MQDASLRPSWRRSSAAGRPPGWPGCYRRRGRRVAGAVVAPLSTGACKSEILGITWSNVDFQRRMIRLLEQRMEKVELCHLLALPCKKYSALRRLGVLTAPMYSLDATE